MSLTAAPLQPRQSSNTINSDNCYVDVFGQVNCSNWSFAERVGIGLGIAVGIIVLFMVIGCLMRKRRSSRSPPPTRPHYNAPQSEVPNDTQYVPTYTQGGYSYPPTSQQNYYGPPSEPPPDADQPYLPPSVPPPSYQKDSKDVEK